MTFAEAVVPFTAQLCADPAAPRPPLRYSTYAELCESRMLDRAFDPAQMDLGLVTPSEMQRINSTVQVDHSTVHRVIRYEQYV